MEYDLNLIIINLKNMEMMYYVIIGIIVLATLFIRQINQYQRGVMFSLGKYTGTKNPGWRVVIPIFQQMKKVDIRVKAVDVPYQEAITKDNVSVKVNAVIYYKVTDAAKAFIEVENFMYAVLQLAQTTMRNVVGEVDLDTLLSQREKISERIGELVEKACDPWGIKASTVELKDIILPEGMVRTIAKQAEAEREKRAVIINAEGEMIAAENVAKAAERLHSVPGALHLRTLQAINDISSDQSNTVVFMVPAEVLRAFDGGFKIIKKDKDKE